MPRAARPRRAPRTDARDGLTRAIDALKFRHVVLFALCCTVYNSWRGTGDDVGVEDRGVEASREGAFVDAAAGGIRTADVREASSAVGVVPGPASDGSRRRGKEGEEEDTSDDEWDAGSHVTPARSREEEEPGSSRPSLGCRVTIPPRGHWTTRDAQLTEETPTRERCRWACVAGYRKVRVGEKDKCIPCQAAILPASAWWVTDVAGSSCDWRCKTGFRRVPGTKRCAACPEDLPANAEWHRVDGDCAWRCKDGYAGGPASEEDDRDRRAPHTGGGTAAAALGVEKHGEGGRQRPRCAKCVQKCEAGSFMVGEGDGTCPAGTARDARRCERCPKDLPAFTTWTRGCKFRCGNGFYRSPLGCATCSRTCAPGRLLAGVCDPYAFRDGTFCTVCPPETNGRLPRGASYVSHCTHVCPPGQCRDVATDACVNLISPCGPGFKLRGLDENEGACPANAAAAAATLLRRWAKTAGRSASDAIESTLEALPRRASSVRELNPLARFASSLCEPCDTTASGGMMGAMPRGAVWRDGCTWHCPADFYLHTEFDVTANITLAGVGAGAAAPVTQSCLPCTRSCPQGYEAVGDCPAGSNRDGRTCKHCRFGPHNAPENSVRSARDACGYECKEGHFKHPDLRTCLRCTNKCDPGFTPTGECPLGATRDKRCEACPVANLPDGAHFINHCEWECGAGYFRPRGGDTCVRCTHECPAGRVLRGECPAGSRFDAVTCAACDLPLPMHATWLEGGDESAEPCSFECREGFYQTEANQFGHRLCLPCKTQSDCGKGTVLVNSCPVGATSDTSECRACPVAPKGAIYQSSASSKLGGVASEVAPCDWHCGPGFFKNLSDPGNATCTPCTTTCPAGKYLSGSCPMGATEDGHVCKPCGLPPGNSSYVSSSQGRARGIEPGTLAALQLLTERESRDLYCQWECRKGFFRDRVIPSAVEERESTRRGGRHGSSKEATIVDPTGQPLVDTCYPCRTKCPAKHYLTASCPAGAVHDQTSCIRCPPPPRHGVLKWAVLPTDFDLPEVKEEKCEVSCTPPAELTTLLDSKAREHVACLTPDEDGDEAIREHALDVSMRVERMDKARANAAAVERIRETITKRKSGAEASWVKGLAEQEKKLGLKPRAGGLRLDLPGEGVGISRGAGRAHAGRGRGIVPVQDDVSDIVKVVETSGNGDADEEGGDEVEAEGGGVQGLMTQREIDRRMEDLGLKIYTTTGLDDPSLRAVADGKKAQKSKRAGLRWADPDLRKTMLLARAVREQQRAAEPTPDFRRCPQTPRRAHLTDLESCAWSCNTGTYTNDIPNLAPDAVVRAECVPCAGNCLPGEYLVGACPAGTSIDLRRCEPCPDGKPEGAVWRLRPGPVFRPDMPGGGGGEAAGSLPVTSLDILSPSKAERELSRYLAALWCAWDCEEGRYNDGQGACKVCAYTTCKPGEYPSGSCPQGSREDNSKCVAAEFTMGTGAGG